MDNTQSPALAALLAAQKIDSIDDHPEDIKTEKQMADTFDMCEKHYRQKKDGVCVMCFIETKQKVEAIRRQQATVDGNEKWVGNTCFKKGRQTKKYVMKMMGLTGKQYRTLQKETKKYETKKQG